MARKDAEQSPDHRVHKDVPAAEAMVSRGPDNECGDVIFAMLGRSGSCKICLRTGQHGLPGPPIPIGCDGALSNSTCPEGAAHAWGEWHVCKGDIFELCELLVDQLPILIFVAAPLHVLPPMLPWHCC